jgi:hypothetical protein
MKSSRKGAVRAARLKLAVQAHSWIGKDCNRCERCFASAFGTTLSSALRTMITQITLNYASIAAKGKKTNWAPVCS